MMKRRGRTPKKILVLGFDDAQILDITGPIKILTSASDIALNPTYAVTLAGPNASSIQTTCGLKLSVDRCYVDLTTSELRQVDTLIVAGGRGMRQNVADPELMRVVKQTAKHARRITSVCTGAFVLAAAGLLDGKRAVTHWMYCDALSRHFPSVSVD